MPPYYSVDGKDAIKSLNSSEKGLTGGEATKRLEKYGPNELKKEGGIPIWKLFLAQFKSILIIVLIIAAVVSFIIDLEEGKEPIDTIVITIIVVLNAVIGFVQEYKAEKSLDALKALVSAQAKVMREGHEIKVSTSELVPGDIILLEAGDKVPSDGRIISALDLRVDEAALTGESLPVEKSTKKFPIKTVLADRLSMVYSGTVIVYGKATVLVTATGMETELGKIASLVQETSVEETPLQARLDKVGKQLAVMVLIVCVVVFATEVLKNGSGEIMEFFLVAVALAVAAIPEGLPAVVTMALALGTQRMVKRKAIIRKLPAVETLGSCDVICSDKTGTFTKNEMTVRKIAYNNREINVSGSGYEPKGDFSENGKLIDVSRDATLMSLLRGSVLCNNASLESGGIGDPTEIALITLGGKAGIIQESATSEFPREKEVQFDSERKRMSTVNKIDGKEMVYCKGATEIILDLCDSVFARGKKIKLDAAGKRKLLEKNDVMASDALRVLGIATKELKKKGEAIETGLTFLGMIGMIDPPREEVKGAISLCKEAGIAVKMITGDHAITASAIAREIGLPKGETVTGTELESMSEPELEKRVESITVFARVNPEHKLRIVAALKKNGHIVAMTGDGVNDAPALKKADIGIAMGISGTEVTKEAAAMVLADDNFATIVSAVEEGRGIYDNIKKFICFLLSSNSGEVMSLFFGILLFPLVGPFISAIQILWINLITDGAPALALGVDPKPKDLMKRAPRNPKESIFSGIMLRTILLTGIVLAVGTLGVYYAYNPLFVGEGEIALKASTMAFSVLVMFQLVNVFNCKTEKESLFSSHPFNNKWLILAVIVGIVLQCLIIYVPFLAEAFGTVPLSVFDWGVIFGVALSVLVVIEIYKAFERWHDKNLHATCR